MNCKTRITKGREGWEAESRIPLEGDEITEGCRFLQLHTYKGTRGLVTTASVHVKTDGGFSFVMFQDYHKTLIQSKSRCTDKNVEIQHNTAVNDLAHILADARIHYMKGDTA